MPNWCQNRLTVSGDAKDVKAFINKAKSKDMVLDFNSFIEMPKELANIHTGSTLINGRKVSNWRLVKDGKALSLSEAHFEDDSKGIKAVAVTAKEKADLLLKYGCTDWYEWSSKNWGTKWNADKSRLDVDDGVATYVFGTAWAPPSDNLLKAMSKMFPKLEITIEYAERGMMFYGRRLLENGKVMINSEGSLREQDFDEEGNYIVDDEFTELVEHSG